MKILHLMLSCFYIDKANYQENIIPKLNKAHGHEVEIIASLEVFVKHRLELTLPSTYVNEDGIKVTRIAYTKNNRGFIYKKLRIYQNLYGLISQFHPDVILFHGACAWAINDVAKYKKNHPEIHFYVDSHEDFNNSAQTFFSKQILHNLFYKRILKKNLKYIEKILYITKETHTFLSSFYKISEDKLFFFPLGGIIPDEKERNQVRNRIRKELKVNENELLCIHSGKLDLLKRTLETLEGFTKCESKEFRLIIIGSMDKTIDSKINDFLKKDSRIEFLGWKSSDELQEYLMAGDLYIQLGSQSVTMQQAICNGCVVAVYPHESHLFLLKSKAYYINNSTELTNLLNSISQNRDEFSIKRKELSKLANEVLDYNEISTLIYENNNFQK